MPTLEEGQTFTHERTFTRADVQQFADVTGDTQDRHTDPDDDGRVLVQGLLTGSLMTKIGGDHEVLATRMEFRFRRPVYAGDTIRCTWTNERVEDRPDGIGLEANVVFRRVEDGSPTEVVLEAAAEGIVYE